MKTRGIFTSWVALFTYRHIVERPFLVAQAVKNLPAIQETRVRSLGWKDSLEKGIATHSGILAWEFMDRGAWWTTVHRVTEQDTA